MSAASKKGTKQTVADILKDIDMTSSELSTTEAKKLQELDKILSESPDLKNLSMDEIIGMLNISEDDKKQLASQVNDILKSGDLDMKDAELRKKFPAMDPTIENIMNDLFYFSYITILTGGYGDIVPVSWVARNATILAALAGNMYSLVVISSIVSRAGSSSRR